jgi:hypothetical protein
LGKAALFLMGLHTSADKGSVKIAGGERGNTPTGMSGEEARGGQRRRLYELCAWARTSMYPDSCRGAERPIPTPTLRQIPYGRAVSPGEAHPVNLFLEALQ